MTEVPVALDDLVRVREDLVAEAVGRMPDAHRRFLLSFELGKPEWVLLEASNAASLPAVRWRIANLERLDGRRRSALAAQLEAVFCRFRVPSVACEPGLDPRMTGMETSEPQDIVDASNERLDVEYKAWLDLGDRAVQADLARRLRALANCGRGYVVTLRSGCIPDCLFGVILRDLGLVSEPSGRLSASR